nr:MAG TPA: minor head component F [Caudoviricetes sp.]
MQSDAFAAQRREQLVAGDDRLGPIVAEALSNLGADGWADPIVDAAGRIWLENYAAEAPDAAYRAGLMRFRQRVAESLEKTTESSNADRITRWLSTYAVNAGTIQGAYRRGVRFKTWVDMEDAAVRDAHRHAAGQVVPIGGAFTVGGVKMGYPGEPVGPIELWINCRCVAQPAARSGETMSENTLDLGSNAHTRALVADAGAEEPRTGALVVLLPADDDPITAATSEDQAHMTFVWMGDVSDIDDAARAAIGGEVSSYAAALDGPIVVPVMRRGQLGDDGADVVFLERSDSLLAARDGLMESSPNLLAAYDAAEQFPEWTPHVTLGYPEGVEGGPAVGEYDGTEVTFDRLGLWLGGDYTEYPMGGVMSDTIIADAGRWVIAHSPDPSRIGMKLSSYQDGQVDEEVALDKDDEIQDEPEEDEEPITEIPVHGVLAPEGVETGDGRGFREGAISSRPLPYPLRLEVVGTHGGTTSDVVTVGRIDEAWRDDATGMWRFRGAIILSKPQASAAIEGIIDGSGTGVSIDADAMAVDMEGFSDEAVVTAEAAGKNPTTWFSETRIAGLTIVPIPAFHEAYIALGHDFVEDMTEEQITAAAGILEDCGCADGPLEMPVLAQGGIVPGGARVLVGEGGPGYIVPLSAPSDQNRELIAQIARGDVSFAPGSAEASPATAAGGLSAERGFTTSPAPTAGTSGLSMEFSDGRVVPATSMDAASGTVRLSDGTVLVAQRPERAFSNPTTRDGPGWITHPIPTSRIRRYWVRGEGAAKIRWGEGGDFNRCRAQLAKYVQNPEWLAGLCANMHKEALGIWPAQHAASARAAVLASGALPSPMINLVEPEPGETITAAAGFPGGFPAEWFANPKFRQLTPLTIDKESGRIFGHLAQWGVCHIGVSGSCVKPPHSRSNYANFLKGVVDTTAGEQPVGCFTYGIGHADPRLRAAAATAHYDRPDAVVAYVNVGEDSYGIWYSGVLRPGVDEALVDEFRAVGAVSGDWRPIGHFGLDLVASVAVNTPGFPVSIAASGGEVTALIAAGMVMQPDPEPESAPESFADANADFLAAAIAKAMDKRENQKREQALRQRAHTIRQADLRRRAQKKG